MFGFAPQEAARAEASRIKAAAEASRSLNQHALEVLVAREASSKPGSFKVSHAVKRPPGSHSHVTSLLASLDA